MTYDYFITAWNVINNDTFLPLTFFVDVVFGDAVTGVKTPIKQKMLEHIKTFKDLWWGM